MRFNTYNNSCKVSHPNLSNIPLQGLLNAIQKISVLMNLREIKELGLNQVLKKEKTLINKPKLACMLLKIIP